MRRFQLHPDLYDFLRIAVVTAALSFVATILIDPIWGFYDSFMATLAGGQVAGVYFSESYHLGMNPMVKLMGILHRMIPYMPWTGLLMISLWVYIQSLSIFLVLRLLGAASSLRNIWFVWLALLLFVFGFSFIEYSITGMGIIVSFISLISIWYAQRSGWSVTMRWLVTIILSIGFICGYSLRIESGLGGTLLGVLFILLRERSPLVLLRAAVIPAILVLLFFIRFQQTIEKHYFFKTVEPLVFYVTDSHNPPPLHASDSIEEIKNRLIRASFLIDTFQFNYAIYHKLADEKWEYEKGHTFRSLDTVYQIARVAGPTIRTNLILTFVFLLIVLISMWSTFASGRAVFYPLLIFNFLFVLIVCFLAYSMKMEKWHYVPLVQCALWANIIYTLGQVNFQKYSRSLVLWSSALLLGLIAVTGYVISISDNRRNINEKKQIADVIFADQKEHMIFLDVNTREILDDYVFRHQMARHDLYFYDLAQFDFLPEYERRLDSLCGCNAHSAKEFFGFFRKNTARIDYYATMQRVSMMSEFMRKVYGVQVTFTPVTSRALKENHYGLDSIVRYRIDFP